MRRREFLKYSAATAVAGSESVGLGKRRQSGHSLNSNLSATFPARLASVMDSKKISECSIGLVLPAR